MNRQLSSTVSDIITALSYALDLDENRKLYHAWRVAVIANEAAALLPSPPDREQLFYAALLHDIGAIGFSDYVMHAPSIWPQYSIPFLKGHCRRGAAILENIPHLEEAAGMVLDHHEWWNGSGYPDRKKEGEISEGGLLIRIADSAETIIQELPTLTKSKLFFILKERIDLEYPKVYYDAVTTALSRDSLFENLYDFQWIEQRIKAIQAELAQQNQDSSRSDITAVIRVFAQTIDAKHEYTAGHSERVAMYAYYLGKTLGLSSDRLRTLTLASLLHDAGKLAVNRNVLEKPGKLTLSELKQIRMHPVYGEKIISSIPGFDELALVAGQHHEWLNGQGYPRGIKNGEITSLARIVTVADAFDAMTTNRSYQKARSAEVALGELEKEAGSHFDPEIVRVARKTFSSDLPSLANFSLLLDSEF